MREIYRAHPAGLPVQLYGFLSLQRKDSLIMYIMFLPRYIHTYTGKAIKGQLFFIYFLPLTARLMEFI